MLTTFDSNALRAARLAKGLTQAAAGYAAGMGDKCPGQTWAAYESGRVPHPRRETLLRMAQALGVDVAALMAPTHASAQTAAPTATAPATVASDMDDLTAAYLAGYNAGQQASRQAYVDLMTEMEALRMHAAALRVPLD